MKLLREFFRLRIAGCFLLSGRRDVSRRSWTITVPEPLAKPVQRGAIDMHWHADPACGRPVAHWHDHAASQKRSHLQLVSSH